MLVGFLGLLGILADFLEGGLALSLLFFTATFAGMVLGLLGLAQCLQQSGGPKPPRNKSP